MAKVIIDHICKALLVTLNLFVTASPLYGYGIWEEDLIGTLAQRTQKNSHLWSSLSSGFVDGRIKTTPPNEIIYDRRIESRLHLGGEMFYANRFGLRLNLTTDVEKRRVAGDDITNGAIVDEQKALLRPSLDGTFVTDKGLEIILGMTGLVHGTDKKVTATNFGNTTVIYKPARALGRRLAILRRAPQWNGGFAYTMGSDSSRSVREEVFDGSSTELVETIFLPSRIDMFGEAGKAGTKMRFNLGFIQARGFGPKDNRGATIYTDHLEAILGAQVPLGGLAADGSVGHRTLSYSSSAFVSTDTIPVTTVQFKLIAGASDHGAFGGLYYHHAKDGQSLPEFNSKYDVFGVGINFGTCLRL